MSESVDHRGVIVRAAAPLAALALLASGCNEPRQESAPATWQVTVPDVPTTEAYNECAVDNPEISAFHTSDIINADWEEAGGAIYGNSELTEEQAVRFTADLKTEYGINLLFPEATVGEGIYEFGSINDTPESAKQAKEIAILSVIKAVRMFSPELIKALNLTEVAYVDGITRRDGYEGIGVGEAGGLYNEVTNTIYIDVKRFFDSSLFSDSSSTVVHELSHAIDTQLLCGPDSGTLDEEFIRYNSVLYEGYTGYENDPESLDEKYYRPARTRVFANRYGSASVKEDRATIIEWTFTERGLILAGDPDFDSPLAKKQAILVQRLEQLAPGITSYLAERTAIMRTGVSNLNYSTEMADHLESSLFAGEFLSIEQTLSRARDRGISVEILTNSVVEISHPYLSYPMYAVNPVILRDPSGLIRGIAWTTGYSLNTAYFDQSRMLLRHYGDQPETTSGTMELKFEGNPDTTNYFLPSHLSINGVLATYDYANSDSERREIEQNYPNVFNSLAPENLATTSTTGGLNIPTTTIR